MGAKLEETFNILEMMFIDKKKNDVVVFLNDGIAVGDKYLTSTDNGTNIGAFR